MTDVYVASAWWRDREPFCGVVSKDAETCRARVYDRINEEAQAAVDRDGGTGKTKDDYMNEMAWTGVLIEDVKTYALNDEQKRDLDTNGYVYLNTS